MRIKGLKGEKDNLLSRKVRSVKEIRHAGRGENCKLGPAACVPDLFPGVLYPLLVCGHQSEPPRELIRNEESQSLPLTCRTCLHFNRSVGDPDAHESLRGSVMWYILFILNSFMS